MKILKNILITFILSILILTNCVFAQETTVDVSTENTPTDSATTDDSSIVATNEETTDTTTDTTTTATTTPEDSSATLNTTYKESLFINTPDEDYTLNEVIDGYAFIIAKDVTISNIVGGGLFVIAENIYFTGTSPYIQGNVYLQASNSIILSSNSLVYATLYAHAKTMTIDGTIYDAYLAGDNVTIEGDIYRDCSVCVKDTFALYGTVQRNLKIDGGKTYNFTTDEAGTEVSGQVGTSLSYTNTSEKEIPDTVIDSEKITYTKDNVFVNYLIVIFTLLIIILGVYFAIRFMDKKALDLKLNKESTLNMFKYGFLATIIALVVFIVCTALSLYVASIVIVILGLSYLVISIPLIGYVLTNNIEIIGKQVEWIKVIISLIISVILWALLLVPIVNILALFVYYIVSFGIFITTSTEIATKKEKEKK